MADYLIGLALALSFLFGWNNGSFLIGNLRGSGALSMGPAVLVSGAGLLIGAFAEGPKMTTSLVGSIAPATTTGAVSAMLAASLLLLFLLSVVGRPMSLSMTVVGAFLGATLGAGVAVNLQRTALVIGFWFVAPILTALLTYAIYSVVREAVTNLPLATVDWLNRTGATGSAFLVSYTLGANNLGLLQSSVIAGNSATLTSAVLSLIAAGLALAAVLGAALLGRGSVAGTIGDRMLALAPQGAMTVFISSAVVVWIGTQVALPISIAQCVLGGMFGASFARRFTVINRKLVYETLLSWLVVPLAALGTAFLLGAL
jgi:phosphate/sulfate permease